MSLALDERLGGSGDGARADGINRVLLVKRQGVRTHGTNGGYTKGCRCDRCREAHALWQREYRKTRPEQPRRRRDVLIHGRVTTYRKDQCRCARCRKANTVYTTFRNRWIVAQALLPESARRPCPPPAVCQVCSGNFMGDPRMSQGKRCCSQACASKSWRDRKRALRVIAKQPESESSRARRERLERRELDIAIAQAPELVRLVAEQEKDSRVGGFVSGWAVSLDALALGDEGAERHELIGSDDLDPAHLYEQAECAAHLNEVIGGRTEDDIRRLDYRSVEWLADRLRAEGLAAIPVLASERERLREPQAHSGERILAAGSFGWKAKRREKVRANRHGRPSQKPRKRWSRYELELEAA